MSYTRKELEGALARDESIDLNRLAATVLDLMVDDDSGDNDGNERTSDDGMVDVAGSHKPPRVIKAATTPKK